MELSNYHAKLPQLIIQNNISAKTIIDLLYVNCKNITVKYYYKNVIKHNCMLIKNTI